jgi:L-ascorbate metabolism protein UlaG (beta-lactamase superfamily)
MELTFHGNSCIRLRGRETTVLVDPPTGTTLPGSRTQPDVVVRTDGPTDPDLLRPSEGRPQVVSGPGEFEVRGVSVYGLGADGTVVMRVELDDVRVLATGRLARQLTGDEIDALGHVDVLVLPVGGGDALSASDATKLVNAIEPNLVVPVRYRPAGTLEDGYDTVEKFTKEMGLAEGSWEPQSKLNLTGPMSESEESKVVVLEARGQA